MKRSIIIFALMLLVMASGCQQEVLEIPDESALEENTNGLPQGAFLLTTEDDGLDTKTIVYGTTVSWVEGDTVNINGYNYPIKLSSGKFYIEPGADGTPLIAGDTIRGYYHCGEVENPQSMNPRVYYPEE